MEPSMGSSWTRPAPQPDAWPREPCTDDDNAVRLESGGIVQAPARSKIRLYIGVADGMPSARALICLVLPLTGVDESFPTAPWHNAQSMSACMSTTVDLEKGGDSIFDDFRGMPTANAEG